MTPAARFAAGIDLYEAIAADPRPADAVANAWFRARRFIGGGDRRAIADLVWRALRAQRRILWWLDRAKIPTTPRMVLGGHAVLTGTPPHRLAAQFIGGRFAPQPLTEEENAALIRLEGHTLAHPAMPRAVSLEVPDWILPKLEAAFGDAVEAEIAALSAPAPLDLRANTLKTSRDEAIAALRAEGLDAKPTTLSPFGLRLPPRLSITQTEAFKSGLVEIQDEGSQLIALILDAKPGDRVCDYCAGAAGKTLAIAAGMANKGHIVACDTSAPRLEASIKRLRRAGVHNVERHLLEPGDKWTKRQAQKFDRVLVDAPCTGTGTWRRNPDARLTGTETDLAEIVAKQKSILDNAQKLLRIGGRLVYATCSVLDDENDVQIEAFLARHPGFRRVSLGAPLPAELHGPALHLSPRRHGTDGFFAAVLERTT